MVGAGGTVEGDPLLYRTFGPLDLLLIPTGYYSASADDIDIRELSSRPLGPGLNPGEDYLSGVPGSVEGMQPDAFTELAAQAAVVLVDGSDVDRDVAICIGARVEDRGDEGELVVLTLEVRSGTGLKGIEDGPEAEDVLPKAGAWW